MKITIESDETRAIRQKRFKANMFISDNVSKTEIPSYEDGKWAYETKVTREGEKHWLCVCSTCSIMRGDYRILRKQKETAEHSLLGKINPDE